jgi:poly-gamma-glutamate capsule biosynthesis protein CapA/YwtB (metallophosphatase superfamily)
MLVPPWSKVAPADAGAKLLPVPIGGSAGTNGTCDARFVQDGIYANRSASDVDSTMQRIRILLCGDVMTGRGIDQVLAFPCDPHLHENHVQSALDYVELAEKAHGAIPRYADSAYIWGETLGELNRSKPDVRVVNLETSITRSEDYVPKGINYRMSPENAECLTAFGIDCCVLANNHVLDWGRAGLMETLETLERLNIKTAGAGRNLRDAAAPAVVEVPGRGRVLVLSLALPDSGVPRSWAAGADAPGIHLVTDLTEIRADQICKLIARVRQSGDIVIVSIHWGPNWGYEVPSAQRRFAHALVDRSGVSVVHGHSSHHAKAIEVYRDRLILYGCGDFLNDYEGIAGYEAYRSDLALMYIADFIPVRGDLTACEIVPFQIRRFRLNRASRRDVGWLRQTLARESNRLGSVIIDADEGRLSLTWPAQCGGAS